MDIVDIDSIAREQAENEGVPTRLLNTQAEVKSTRDKRQKDMDRQKQIALAQAEGDAAQSVGAGNQAMKEAGQGAT